MTATTTAAAHAWNALVAGEPGRRTMTNAETTLRAHLREHPLDTSAHLALADAMADAGDEQAAILHRIVHDSDNDDWRLQYASLLEREIPQRVRCPKCNGTQWVPERDVASGRHEGGRTNCKRCTGGEVIDTVRADRADYIRCQIELAGLVEPSKCQRTFCDGSLVVCDSCKRWKSLRRCESELLTRHRTRWLPTCQFCDGYGDGDPRRISPNGCPACKGTGHAGDMRRGFLRELEVPTLESALAPKECEECSGFGTVRAEYDRSQVTCPKCHGDQHVRGEFVPTDFARGLFRGEFATVERVVAKDREPLFMGDIIASESRYRYRSPSDGDQELRHYLPQLVLDRMPNAVRWPDSPFLVGFATAEAAREDAATALCDTLRALVEGET